MKRVRTIGLIAILLSGQATALAAQTTGSGTTGSPTTRAQPSVDPDDKPNDPVSLRAEAFEAAQMAVTSTAAAALTKVAAAFSKGGDAVAGLERRRTDLSRQREAADKRYTDLLGDETPEHVQMRAEFARQAEALREQIRQAEAQIARLNPGYYELTRPRSLTVAETQALLNPDEAILLLLVSDDATYVFGITRERLEWARTDTLGEKALLAKVTMLREGLQTDADPNRGTVAQAEETSAPAPFNRALSYELYRGLVQPVEALFAGKRLLMTIATGPLGSLPLQLLVTEPPVGRDGDTAALAGTSYLIDRYAMATLPAVSSLQALRCLLVVNERRHPGCGAATGSVPRKSQNAKIELVGFGAPTLRGAPLPAGSRAAPAGFGNAFKGELADTSLLRELPYLAGSRRELEALGTRYGADRSLIRLGDAATEQAVKSSAELARARYLIFSTHGLLAGEGGVQGEPGLVFTPPNEQAKSAADDGLLTASEAAQLTLSADIVVLSACNTAASDGQPGGEGLSGLARSFFFAGARSLFVSHWQVSDAATSMLMTRTFAALDDAKTRDRAEAVRTAMRSVRSDARWASPGYWAAFTLVGVPE